MSKGTHFIGQPLFGQLISLLDKSKILKFSREKDGERYVKHFNAWQHMGYHALCRHQKVRLSS